MKTWHIFLFADQLFPLTNLKFKSWTKANHTSCAFVDWINMLLSVWQSSLTVKLQEPHKMELFWNASFELKWSEIFNFGKRSKKRNHRCRKTINQTRRFTWYLHVIVWPSERLHLQRCKLRCRGYFWFQTRWPSKFFQIPTFWFFRN